MMSPPMVASSIPPKTAVPNETRLAAPAPVAMTSGMTPRIKLNAVIRMARKRSVDAAVAASKAVLPSWLSWFANSTMRIALLDASPINSTSPICM